MKQIILLIAAISLSSSAYAVDADSALNIAKKSNCLTCHNVEKKILGPSWRDVGKKYASNPNAAEQLAATIKKGGKGVWGPIPMPPNANVSDDDIRTLVTFILSLK